MSFDVLFNTVGERERDETDSEKEINIAGCEAMRRRKG